MLRSRSALAIACLFVFFIVGCNDNVAYLTIEGKDNLTFTPDSVTVKPGQQVELTLVNKGKLPHTFTVPDLNIEVQMPVGETNKITFVAPQAGEYQFFSGVIGEFDVMKGKIIVR